MLLIMKTPIAIEDIRVEIKDQGGQHNDEKDPKPTPRAPDPEPHPEADSNTEEDDNDEHRGRIQVQWSLFKKDISRSWTRSTPSSVSEGLAILDDLWATLSRREQRQLNQGFAKARTWIENCSPGGCAPPGKNRFINRGVNPSVARVDVEIHRGLAFT